VGVGEVEGWWGKEFPGYVRRRTDPVELEGINCKFMMLLIERKLKTSFGLVVAVTKPAQAERLWIA
jgi:hypothetical protein